MKTNNEVMSAGTNEQIQTIISTFAKENKISKVKLLALVDSILCTIPKHTRKVSSKTQEATDNLKTYIRQGVTDSVALRKNMQSLGLSTTDYNNLIYAAKKRGIIKVEDRISTGKRGRKAQVFSLVTGA